MTYSLGHRGILWGGCAIRAHYTPMEVPVGCGIIDAVHALGHRMGIQR